MQKTNLSQKKIRNLYATVVGCEQTFSPSLGHLQCQLLIKLMYEKLKYSLFAIPIYFNFLLTQAVCLEIPDRPSDDLLFLIINHIYCIFRFFTYVVAVFKCLEIPDRPDDALPQSV